MSRHEVLNSADHGELRIHTGAGVSLGDSVMACLTVPAEFRAVQAHYPIVFQRDLASGQLTALALFGFQNGENLFLDGDAWDAPYRPAAISIQPFLIGRYRNDDASAAQVHVDMDHPRIAGAGEGVRVFDESGQPTPWLEEIAGRLGDLDGAYRDSAGFFAAIDAYGLVEPFTLEVPLDDGSRHSLVGYQTIDEQRLAALDGDALGRLMADGHLAPIFMALASLSQFQGLIARKNRQIAGG